MGASIELWTYRLFNNQTLYIEEVQQKELATRAPDLPESSKNPVMVEAGKKAALARKTGVYSFEGYIKDKPQLIREIVLTVQEFVMSLDAALEESPKKFYVAYRTTQNIVCVEAQHRKVYLFLKLNPKRVAIEKGFTRDVTDIGHFGTGDLEVTLQSLEDVEKAKPLIQQAFDAVGG